MVKRIERLEQQARKQARVLSRTSPECICFPESQIPDVGFPIEEEIAFLVKCPLHGDRFRRRDFWVYKSKWLREKTAIWVGRQSTQYRKAYEASFPSYLWPAVEEDTEEGTYLRLKDGTRIPAWR